MILRFVSKSVLLLPTYASILHFTAKVGRICRKIVPRLIPVITLENALPSSSRCIICFSKSMQSMDSVTEMVTLLWNLGDAELYQLFVRF